LTVEAGSQFSFAELRRGFTVFTVGIGLISIFYHIAGETIRR